jgi:hypothetical protein
VFEIILKKPRPTDLAPQKSNFNGNEKAQAGCRGKACLALR